MALGHPTHFPTCWLNPGFLLKCEFTPGTAEPLARSLQMVLQQTTTAPNGKAELHQSCPHSPPQESQQDTATNQPHCEMLLFTETFVKSFLES